MDSYNNISLMPSAYIRPVLVKAMIAKSTTKGVISKSSNFTVESEVLVPQQDGTNKQMFFKDYEGNRTQLLIPRGGLKMDKSNDVDAHNLALLKLKIQYYPHVRDRVVVLDDEVKAEQNVRMSESTDFARAAIRTLNKEQGIAAIRDFVVIVRGSVSPMTDSQLIEVALGLAEQDPDGTLSLLGSDKFANARKLNRLIAAGEVTVSDSGAVFAKDGSVIAESAKAAMLSLSGIVEKDPVVETGPVKEEDSEDSHIQHILSKSGVANDPMKIEEDEIARVVNAAVSKGYFERGPNHKFKMDGSDRFNMSEPALMDHFLSNPSQAAVLKKNLVERGLIKNVTD